MPANYRILNDGRFTLAAGEDKLFGPFNLPDGTLVAGKHRPILAFVVKPAPQQDTILFRLDFNDSPQINTSLSVDESGGRWETLNANIAVVGNNTIQFRVISGSGSITFSEVVLWYST